MLQPLKDAFRKYAKNGRDKGAKDLDIKKDIKGAIKNLNAKHGSTGLELDAKFYANMILRDIGRDSNLGSSNAAAPADKVRQKGDRIVLTSDDEAPADDQALQAGAASDHASSGRGGRHRPVLSQGVGEVPEFKCGRCGHKTKIAKTSPCSNPACPQNLQRGKNHHKDFKCGACKQSFKMKKGLTVHKARWCRYRADVKSQGRGSKPWERGAKAVQASRKTKRTPVEKVSSDGKVQPFDSVLDAARHLAQQESPRNPNFTTEMARSKIRKNLSDKEKLEDGSFYRYTDCQEGQGSAPPASQDGREAGGAGGGAARVVAHLDDACGFEHPRGRDEEMVESECGSDLGPRKRTPTDRFKFPKTK